MEGEDAEKDGKPEDDSIGQSQLQITNTEEDRTPTQVQRQLQMGGGGRRGSRGGCGLSCE